MAKKPDPKPTEKPAKPAPPPKGGKPGTAPASKAPALRAAAPKAQAPKAAAAKAPAPKSPAAKAVPPKAPAPKAPAPNAPAPKVAAPKAAAPKVAPAKKAAKPKAPSPEADVAAELELDPTALPAVPKSAPSVADFPIGPDGEVILPPTPTEEAPPPPKEEKPKVVLPIPKDLPPRRADGTITVAHSPDADDAFMFYALANGKVDTEDRKYDHVLKDIQTLNEAAKKGTYDVTAISFHAYPYVRRNYALLTCGASFGDAYGPILVAKTPIRPAEVEGMTVAIPGELTTAALVTKMWFGRARIVPKQVPFDKVTDLVRAGLVRAGVIIHEGQLTYKEQGLVKVVDFGQWWSDSTEGLPLPLGGNGVRRDLPAPLVSKIALDLKRSIAFALGHREEALAYAMKFGRNLPKEKADKFVGMYVNDLTLDYGERGRQAVRYLLDRAVREGFLKESVEPEFVG